MTKQPNGLTNRAVDGAVHGAVEEDPHHPGLSDFLVEVKP
jgi:hypothetical protein